MGKEQSQGPLKTGERWASQAVAARLSRLTLQVWRLGSNSNKFFFFFLKTYGGSEPEPPLRNEHFLDSKHAKLTNKHMLLCAKQWSDLEAQEPGSVCPLTPTGVFPPHLTAILQGAGARLTCDPTPNPPSLTVLGMGLVHGGHQ